MIKPQKGAEDAEKMASASIPLPSDGRWKLFGIFFAFLRPCTGFVPVLVLLLFVGTLLWAKQQDPFSREWFTLKTAEHDFFECVAVLPKPIHPRPVIIYAHGSGGCLMNDGFELRQIAELGLAVVSLEYNQTNEAAFPEEMAAVQHYLAQQKWADTNAIAWVGFNTGANRMLKCAWQHPEWQPQLIVQLGGAGLPVKARSQKSGLRSQVILIHGEQDVIFPVDDTNRLSVILKTNGVAVELKTIFSASHSLGAERGTVFRGIGEYCLMHLSLKAESGKRKTEINLVTPDTAGKTVWQNYCSIARWQAAAPALWWFWLPAGAWIAGWLARWRFGRLGRIALPKKPPKRHEIILRWLAVLLAVWAMVETAFHLIPPRLSVNKRTLGIARRLLVLPKEIADFEYLASQPIWHGERLKTLLTHVELAGYNREIVNWQLDDIMYRDYVLSPVITGEAAEQLNWRRPLWEEFYPRIRHESSPKDAAKIVVRHLHERVSIANLPNPPREVPDIWLRQITDEVGFEIIYVAALRSVGIPARLDANRHAEFSDGNKWYAALKPSVIKMSSTSQP